ncbi:hypothetical protein [Streptomyces sp. NPDC006739]|uniref:hypothetical protein n=1 Tax=Streptomyces sp. NPDC006739 TaxID=3364763 RepID=UPI0036A3A4C5
MGHALLMQTGQPEASSKNSAPNAVSFEPLCGSTSGIGSTGSATGALTERIYELTGVSRKFEPEMAQLRPLADHVQELQQDLAAARTGLRQMIRDGNQRDFT